MYFFEYEIFFCFVIGVLFLEDLSSILFLLDERDVGFDFFMGDLVV